MPGETKDRGRASPCLLGHSLEFDAMLVAESRDGGVLVHIQTVGRGERDMASNGQNSSVRSKTKVVQQLKSHKIGSVTMVPSYPIGSLMYRTMQNAMYATTLQ